MTKPLFTDGPLDTLFSARIRLTEDERSCLKTAQNELRRRSRVETETPVMAGSSISVSTATSYAQDEYQRYGLSDLVLTDTICSRDSISMAILLKIEKLLQVKILTRKRLMDRFVNYLDYLDIQ